MKPWKSFSDLRCDDFDAWSIWVGCHGLDQNAPWYEDTDEESFRPWRESLPIDISVGMFLVLAKARFATGQVVTGFLTPDVEMSDLGVLQPHLFLPSGSPFGSWEGMFPNPDQRRRIYDEFGVVSDQLFPIQFSVDPAFLGRAVTVIVDGFHSCPGGFGSTPEVHR